MNSWTWYLSQIIALKGSRDQGTYSGKRRNPSWTANIGEAKGVGISHTTPPGWTHPKPHIKFIYAFVAMHQLLPHISYYLYCVDLLPHINCYIYYSLYCTPRCILFFLNNAYIKKNWFSDRFTVNLKVNSLTRLNRLMVQMIFPIKSCSRGSIEYNYLIVAWLEKTNNTTIICTPFAQYSWITTIKLEVVTKAEVILIHNKEN